MRPPHHVDTRLYTRIIIHDDFPSMFAPCPSIK